MRIHACSCCCIHIHVHIHLFQTQLSSLRDAHAALTSSSATDIKTLSHELTQAQRELAMMRGAAEQRAKIVAEAVTRLKAVKPYVGIELAASQVTCT